jgi:hypothetical protein
MVASESLRSVRVHLGTNKFVQVRVNPVEPGQRDEVLERYGKFSLPPPPGSVDPLEWAPTYMEQAKRILTIDKYHNQIAFLFGPNGQFASFEGMPADHQAKYLLMNQLADEVKRTGATGIAFIADAWYVPENVEIPEGKRPGDMEERQEALHVTAATSDGSVRELVTPYTRRSDGTIEFGETFDAAVEGGSVFLLPVMQAWGLPGRSEQDALQKVKAQPKEEPSSPSGSS